VVLCARAVAALASGLDPKRAAEIAIGDMTLRVGASGGLILATPSGRLGFARSTRTMTWAAAWDGGADGGA
jgi:isoaspartyl peptidase/L-asparaginase-like protein (Ntn-hydrolase superfamily)